MIAWGRKSDIQSGVANVPDKWLIGFAIARPGDVRKFGESSNSTLLYRAAAVLEAVESGVYFGASRAKTPEDMTEAKTTDGRTEEKTPDGRTEAKTTDGRTEEVGA